MIGGDNTDNFKIIYKILKYLEQSMDCQTFDIGPISSEQLRISHERWSALLRLLQDDGYISGLSYYQTMSDAAPQLVEPVRIRITLKGLEYLAENGTMRKVENILKGLKETIPGI